MFTFFVSARKFLAPRCSCFIGASGCRWIPRLSLIVLLWVLENASGTIYAEPLRAVIVHEACRTGGFGAELAALIQEKLFDVLHAPVKRVAAKDVPMPFSPPLEDFVLPDRHDVVEAVKAVMRY